MAEDTPEGIQPVRFSVNYAASSQNQFNTYLQEGKLEEARGVLAALPIPNSARDKIQRKYVEAEGYKALTEVLLAKASQMVSPTRLAELEDLERTANEA